MQPRRQGVDGKRNRRVDLEAASGHGTGFGDEAIRRFNFRQDDPDPFIKRLPNVGQALASRRPVQQAYPHLLLKRLDVLADQLRRHSKRVGGRGKRAQIDGFHKDAHARQSVH